MSTMTSDNELEKLNTEVQSLVGKTIKAVKCYDQSPGSDWAEHERFTIQFTDGTECEFGSWGFDSYGASFNGPYPITEPLSGT